MLCHKYVTGYNNYPAQKINFQEGHFGEVINYSKLLTIFYKYRETR